MLGTLTKNWKKSPSLALHLNGITPVSEEPPREWYEVALCERGEDEHDLVVKAVRRALALDVTFTQDDGLNRENEYAVVYRKVKVDEDGDVLFGKWSDPTTWAKPYARPK